ncbi:hypothetical protein IFO69_07570 [Echinicola sp. CAU 1574]|uniref:Uncharacterized protein n=1 Tax=Echinicola arenosa TaxID=2774144 RepID=A0ABR9AJS7_9BACT|nr:hypothetical protein [Echinicola arenosa]MBD8488597.1 hypothetical protein [Echinicola arenosa]
MRLFLIVSFLMSSLLTYAQNAADKLYLPDETMEVTIEEVGTNVIKYRHLGEQATYEISKNRVNKIQFASGREEVFLSAFNDVHSIDDYQKVYISYVPEDVKGLLAKGEVFAKATGVTTLSSINNVKNRAVKKAKIEAAMLGANVIYVGNMFQRGNQYGSEETPGNSTMTSISGMAYNSNPINIPKTKEWVENQKFTYSHSYKLNRNAWDAKIDAKPIYDEEGNINFLTFEQVVERDGKLFVEANFRDARSKELEVIRADNEQLILMERDGKTIYNYLFLSENEARIINAKKAFSTAKY